jgi:hypothetical protein
MEQLRLELLALLDEYGVAHGMDAISGDNGTLYAPLQHVDRSGHNQ